MATGTGNARISAGGGVGCPWVWEEATCGAGTICIPGQVGDRWVLWGFDGGPTTDPAPVAYYFGSNPCVVVFNESGTLYLSGNTTFVGGLYAELQCGDERE